MTEEGSARERAAASGGGAIDCEPPPGTFGPVDGATAAKSVLGPGFRLTKQHGVPVPSDAARHVTATIHPSAVLRAPPGERNEAMAGLVADLEASLALRG